jgi:diguanylate cyclase (GGDEF)-like protein
MSLGARLRSAARLGPVADDFDAEYWDRQIRVGGWVAVGITLFGCLRIALDWEPALRWWAWPCAAAALLQAALTRLPWKRLVRRPGVREALILWWVLELPVLLAFSRVDAHGDALYLPGALLVIKTAAALYPPGWVIGLGAVSLTGYAAMQTGPNPPGASFAIGMTALLAAVVGFSARTAANRWHQDERRREAERRSEALLRSAAELEEELTRRAFTDPLTGLANRARFDERLSRTMDRVRAGETGAALLLIDLNGFKEVNDTWGHAAGDAVLVATGVRIARLVGPGATLARLGGDEFAVLVEGIGEAAGNALAGSIAATADEPIAVGVQSVRCGMSVGVAVVPAGDRRTTGSGFLRSADLAMYRVKRAGRVAS